MILPPINWENLPDFQIGQMGFEETESWNVNAGWDIRGVKRTPERTAEIMEQTNGVLANSKERMRFFINDIQVGIGIGGTYGQGRRIRDFYPQALSLPSYTIIGQSLTQEDYGLLCEFVHNHQQDAVGSGNTIQLSVREGIPYGQSENAPGSRPLYEGHEAGGSIAGWHAPIEAQGFILEMPRKHERFVYTPTWEFQFAVMWSHTGIFSGQAFSLETTQKSSIIEIIEGQEQPFNQTPHASSVKKTAAPVPPVPEFGENLQKAQEKYNEELGRFNKELREGKKGVPPVPTFEGETKRQKEYTEKLGKYNEEIRANPPKPKVAAKSKARK